MLGLRAKAVDPKPHDQAVELGFDIQDWAKEGALADLILVDGDPLADIAILQKKERLTGIMKDGRFHKAPQ